MKKGTTILLIVFLMVITLGALVLNGSSYTEKYALDKPGITKEDVSISLDGPDGVIEVSDYWVSDRTLYVKYTGRQEGKVYVDIKVNDTPTYAAQLYVHPFSLVTVNNYFGKCTGDTAIPVAISLLVLGMIVSILRKYNAGMQDNIFQYSNVRYLGLVIFLTFILLSQIIVLVGGYGGMASTIRETLGSARNFSLILFPLAFISSLLVTFSNLRLMIREGRNWRNMLGFILGIVYCVSTLIPMWLEDFLQWHTFIDVHNEKGLPYFLELLVENGISAVVAYLECILLATISISIKAARNNPPYDRDYVMILGCMVNPDGTLPPLLKGRADKALAFVRKQEAETGRKAIFIPSGGKGSDEPVSEGEAVKNYLCQQGISEDRIMAETESKTTRENFLNSLALIKEKYGDENPAIAFSTTNYHVFRSGMIASNLGFKVQGMGAGTRSYFWINAFIREYIATIYAELKIHLLTIGTLMAIVLALDIIHYLSIIL